MHMYGIWIVDEFVLGYHEMSLPSLLAILQIKQKQLQVSVLSDNLKSQNYISSYFRL
jgi:hypothetical protein